MLCRLFIIVVTSYQLWATASQPTCRWTGDAPKDVTLRNGSSFTMSCKLTSAVEENLTVGIQRAESWMSRSSSSREVTWKKDNVQGDDSGLYTCVVRGNNCSLSVFNATYLVVAYPPLRPTEHWCRGHNLETFTCYWSVPKLSINTTYRTVLLVGPKEAHSVVDCQGTLVFDATIVTCTLKTAGTPIYRIEERTLHFMVQANNTFGYEQWHYEVDHFSNVQLSAPTGVKCQPSKDSIRVSWDGTDDVSSFPPVVYQTEVSSAYHPTHRVNGKESAAVVDGLVPYTPYEVTVRARFNQSAMWSPTGGVIVCRTTKDRPKAVPKVTVNGFSVDNYAKARKVRVYFQNVPEELWHGEQMTYVLFLSDDNNTVITTSKNHFDLPHLRHDKEYKAIIYSKNEVGPSKEYSNLTIPATDTLLPPVEDAYVDASKGRYIGLYIGKAQANTTYTLFWRCGRDVTVESLYWKVVSADGVDIGTESSSCVYEVAGQNGERVSPMTSIDCVAPGSREYEELTSGKDRVFAAEVTDSNIRLAFLSKCNGMVAKRRIRYHADDGTDNVIILEDKREVTIAKLRSKTSYAVIINSTLVDGRTILHERFQLKTRSSALLVVVIGLCVAFVVFAFIAWILVAWCRRLSVQFIKYKAATVEVLVAAEFPQRRLQRSDSIRSNYFPEHVARQTDSPSGSQSSDVPLLASDETPDQEEALDTGQTASQATVGCTTGYTKVSQISFPLKHLTDEGGRATSSEHSYCKLSAMDTVPPRQAYTVGYSSWAKPYSQLSAMLVNKPQPEITEGYSSAGTTEIPAVLFDDPQRQTADMMASGSPQMQQSPYFKLSAMFALQPEKSTPQKSIDDTSRRHN